MCSKTAVTQAEALSGSGSRPRALKNFVAPGPYSSAEAECE